MKWLRIGLVALVIGSRPVESQERAGANVVRLHVDASAPPGGSGLSWGTAMSDLKEAITAARERAVPEIWVAAGTYRPAPPGGSRDASFVVTSDLAIYGGFSGVETELEQRDPAANRTVLSGDLLGDDLSAFRKRQDNSVHVVRMVASTLRLDGLTISGGFADGGARGAGIHAFKGNLTLSRVFLSGNLCEDVFARGGGLFATRSIVRFEDSTVRANRSRPGGGAFGAGAALADCTVTLAGGRFFRNDADGDGGALYVQRGSLTVRGTSFEENEGRNGGAIDADRVASITVSSAVFLANEATGGGGIFVDMAPAPQPVLVEDCSFTGNLVTSGGGIFLLSDNAGPDLVRILRSTFDANMATSGGGVLVDTATVAATVEDCSFSDNFTTSGGGIAVFDGTADVRRCSFERNVAVGGAGILMFGTASADVERCVFAGNRLHPNPGIGAGGTGIYQSGKELEVRSSVLHDNEKEEVWSQSPRTRILDSTVVHDDPSYVALKGQGTLRGTIVWGANPRITGSWTAEYCDVAGGFAGTGNLDADPLFLDEAGGDLRLQAGSPCIDAGDPGAPTQGLDVSGFPRWLDGDLDGVLAVDIGAHEHDAIELALEVRDGGVEITTTGAAADAALLLAGPASDPMLFPGAGYLFLQPLLVEPWPAPPGTAFLKVPASVAGATFVFQEVATFGPAATVSNPVTVSF